MKNNKTVCIYTLGCRVNQYESCVISEHLRNAGCEIIKSGNCDYYIVNTCAVTAESQRKSRQIVRRCASKGKVVVIGCASQLSDDFSDIGNVIYVGGNRDKLRAVDAVLNGNNEKINCVSSLENIDYEEMNLTDAKGVFSECRAFIKIQDGCNGKCTYCIIPKCRGKIRSRDAESIVAEAKRLYENGYREIILTGIEVSAYNKMPLWELIKKVADVEGIERIRLGSLSPNIINDNFLKTISQLDNFMPHIHLSLQSCSDKILSSMKRPYKKQDILDKVSKIREYIPNCSLSADIIVGFPGETDADFDETVETLAELGIFHVHSFPYSEREGTIAATLPNSVPKKIRAERNQMLIDSCNKSRDKIFDSYCGKKLTLLVEKISEGYAIGHTDEFFEAKVSHQQASVGDVVKILISSHENGVLNGTIC